MTADKNASPQLTVFIGSLEEKSDEFYRKNKNILPHIARVLLVATFLEDGLRILTQFEMQRRYIAGVWACGLFVSSALIVISVFCQLVPAGLILFRRYVDVACLALIFEVFFQRFIYNIAWDEMIPNEFARIGAVLLLLAEACNDANAVPILYKAADHYVDLQNLTNWLQLAGRVFLAFSVEFGITPLQIIKLIVGFSLAILIIIGYKTKLSATVLACWLTLFNFYKVISGWMHNEIMEILIYGFFLNITVVGGLLNVIALGPGTKSIDSKKKYW
ncbi:surfeit locus protein 4 homolog [Paramacrobiotus metropolitanus]|uniref:surfeit locus protein 4 homolog n=1 Tax=Paramacrobiotus metropolitanus TaxID=2943436 RepID=UPI002446500B|nr:surfeit locus protein 4 homolog [Paramacrobiotus metropolitanus]